MNHLTIERRRFGIPLDNDQLYFRDAILEMDAPPLLSASIELESDAGEWIVLPVDVFVIPPLVDDREHSPIRLANRFFEVVLDFEKEWAAITFDYAGDREVDLEEAVSIVQVGAILARPKKTLTIHFKDAHIALPAADEQGPFSHWIPVAPTLRRICSAISRSARRPQRPLRLATFYDWVEENQEILALGSTPGVNLFFPRWSEDGMVDEQDTILTPMSVELAGLQYTALVEIPILAATRDEAEVKIVGGQPHVVDDVIRAAGADTTDFLDLAVESSSLLSESIHQFADWLDGYAVVEKVWLPSIDREGPLRVQRSAYLSICGTISKHGFTRLGDIVRKLRAILAENGTSIDEGQTYLIIPEFQDWFQDNIFIASSTRVAWHLNEIRWGTYTYLRTEFARAFTSTPVAGHPKAYTFDVPATITDPLVRSMYWDLMNGVRSEPYFPRFTVDPFLFKVY